MSFGFVVPQGGDRWSVRADGKSLREIIRVDPLLDVSPTVVRAVEDMVWAVTLDLKLRVPGEPPTTPAIEFVSRWDLCSRGTLDGLHYGRLGLILLARDLKAFAAVRTVAHELRHAWQWDAWPTKWLRDKDRKERDAWAYEEEAARRFFRLTRYAREMLSEIAA